MNKLLGFLELKHSSLPTIPWNEYNQKTELDDKYLWTIRSAVYRGADLNLPRLVGVNAKEAKTFADQLLNKLSGSGLIIYYPYFIADKSGTLNIFGDKIVIEAVKEDLWNLVTYSEKDVTIQINGREITYDGNEKFLQIEEFDQILSYVPRIRSMFRDYILEGKSILLEWSFAFNSDLSKNKIGDKYLVFYEARTV